MTNSGTSGNINKVLVVLVGLLAGLITGYAIGHKTYPTNRAAMSQTFQRNEVIAAENAWIVDGLTCPMPGCTNPLSICQSDIARSIRVWVNEQLKLGRPGEDIRSEIIRVHGANVLKTMPGAPSDTQGTP